MAPVARPARRLPLQRWPRFPAVAVALVASLAAVGEASAGPPPHRRRPPVVVAAAPAPTREAEAVEEAAPVDATSVEPATGADPLLEPLPPPAHTVTSWADVLASLRRRSTDLRVAVADVARAEGQWRGALAGALPTLTGQGTATHQRLSQPFGTVAGAPTGGAATASATVSAVDAYAATASLTQPVLALAAWHGIGTASEAVEAARLDAAETRRKLTASVVGALTATLAAERGSAVARLGLRAAMERLKLVDKRVHFGAATTLDLVRSRIDAEGARAAIVDANEKTHRAREALGLALGVPQAVTVAAGARAEDFARGVREACAPVGSPVERADVRAERRRVRVAERAVTGTFLQLVPTLSAVASASTTVVNAGLIPPSQLSLGASLTVPVWDGGATYGAARSNEAEADKARARAEAAERDAILDIAQSARGVGVATDRLELATTTRDLAREAERLLRVSYDQGRSTSLELVLAGAALRDAEATLVVRELELTQATLAAYLAKAECRW